VREEVGQVVKEETPSDETVEGPEPVPEEAMTEPEPTPEEMLTKERDRYLRLAAEFDNYRKRTERDMSEFKLRAADHLLLALLEVVDNMDRALEALDDRGTGELLAGLKAIRNQMGTILERESIEAIPAVGEEFDPYCMEAVMRTPSDEAEEGRVVSELVKGYKAPTYVLRPSKVVVSSGPRGVTEGNKTRS
jgi:molecular chaperone GrpE